MWQFDGFHLHHQIKIMPFNFSATWPTKVSYVTRKPTNSSPVLARNQVEEANKAVDKVLEWKMMV